MRMMLEILNVKSIGVLSGKSNQMIRYRKMIWYSIEDCKRKFNFTDASIVECDNGKGSIGHRLRSISQQYGIEKGKIRYLFWFNCSEKFPVDPWYWRQYLQKLTIAKWTILLVACFDFIFWYTYNCCYNILHWSCIKRSRNSTKYCSNRP